MAAKACFGYQQRKILFWKTYAKLGLTPEKKKFANGYCTVFHEW